MSISGRRRAPSEFLRMIADSAEIEEALRALKVRNHIAHEGYLPSAVEATGLRKVMGTIQRLAALEEIKSPVLTPTNMLSAHRL